MYLFKTCNIIHPKLHQTEKAGKNEDYIMVSSTNHTSSPLVSIVTPVFNSERYLDQFIGSIRSQTLQDWELILVDDGSADSSAGIAGW